MRQRKNRFLLDEINLNLDGYISESDRHITCYRRGGGGGGDDCYLDIEGEAYISIRSGNLGHDFIINSESVLLDIMRNYEAIFKKHVIIQKSIYDNNYDYDDEDGFLDTLFDITLSEKIPAEEKLRALISATNTGSLKSDTMGFKIEGHYNALTFNEIKECNVLWNYFVDNDTRIVRHRYPIPVNDKRVYRYPVIQVVPLVEICNYWWNLEKAGKARLIDICRLAVKMFFIDEKSPAAVYEYGEYKNLPEVNLPSYDELLERYE